MLLRRVLAVKMLKLRFNVHFLNFITVLLKRSPIKLKKFMLEVMKRNQLKK